MADLFPLWVKILFACGSIIGLFLLIKSVSKMISLYNDPNRVELSAKMPGAQIELMEAHEYEIAVKRRSLFGVIPSNAVFHLTQSTTQKEVPVIRQINFLSQRKSISGERIVPVSEFSISEPGKYVFENLNTEMFKDPDRILITPKTGAKGFLLIFAILFSAILFIGGTVMTILSFVTLQK